MYFQTNDGFPVRSNFSIERGDVAVNLVFGPISLTTSQEIGSWSGRFSTIRRWAQAGRRRLCRTSLTSISSSRHNLLSSIRKTCFLISFLINWFLFVSAIYEDWAQVFQEPNFSKFQIRFWEVSIAKTPSKMSPNGIRNCFRAYKPIRKHVNTLFSIQKLPNVYKKLYFWNVWLSEQSTREESREAMDMIREIRFDFDRIWWLFEKLIKNQDRWFNRREGDPGSDSVSGSANGNDCGILGGRARCFYRSMDDHEFSHSGDWDDDLHFRMDEMVFWNLQCI